MGDSWGDWGSSAGVPPPAPTGSDSKKDYWGAGAPATSGDSGWGTSGNSSGSGSGWGSSWDAPAPASGSGANSSNGTASTNAQGAAGASAWSRHPRIPRAYGGFDWWEELDKAPQQSGGGSGWDSGGGSGWGTSGSSGWGSSGGSGWDSGGSGWGSSTNSKGKQSADQAAQLATGGQILFQSTLPVHLQQVYKELRDQYSNTPGKSKLMHVVAYVGTARDVVYLPPRFPDSIYRAQQREGSRPKSIHTARPFDMIDRKKHDALARSFRAGGAAGDADAGRLVPTVAVGLHGLQGKAAQMKADYASLQENAINLAVDLRNGLRDTAEHLRQAESLQLQQSRLNRRLVSAVTALDDVLLARQGAEAQQMTDGERQLADAVRQLEDQLSRRPRYEGRLEGLHDLYRRSAASFAAGMSAQVEEAAAMHDRFLPEVARHLARHSSKIQDLESELEQAERHVHLMETSLRLWQGGARGVDRGKGRLGQTSWGIYDELGAGWQH